MEPDDFLDRELDRFMGDDALAAERTPRGFAEHLRSSLRDKRLVGAGLDEEGFLLFFRDRAEPGRIRLDLAPATTLADHISLILTKANEPAAAISRLPPSEADTRLREIHESDPGLAALVHVGLRRLHAQPAPELSPLPLPPVVDPPVVEPADQKPAPTPLGRRPGFVGGKPGTPKTKTSIPIT
jgi:hypothetical protein